MDNQNRYEEVPQKENKFVKGLKAFGSYWKFVFLDFFRSFKYNNMKLAAILFALPGILLGFFMFAHVPTIRHVTVAYDTPIEGSNVKITAGSDDDGSYINLEEYTIDGTKYSDLKLYKQSYEDMKSNPDFNPDDVPMDGYAEGNKTKELTSDFKVTLTQVSEDNYSFRVTGMSDEEANEIAYYSVFIYVKSGDKYYYFENAYTQASLYEGAATVTIDSLSEKESYKVAAKAVTEKNSEYYSSKVTSLVSDDTVVTVSTKGSKASIQDYDDNNIKFIADAGLYKSKDADLADFNVEFNANGYIHYNSGKNTVTAKVAGSATEMTSTAIKKVKILPFDFSGMAIFFLTLFGFLNVFVSLDLSKKKNLGSVVKAGLTTLGIVAFGALYIYSIFATENAIKSGGLKLNNITTIIDKNAIISISMVIASAAISVIGIILAFINYDRTYEKVDR